MPEMLLKNKVALWLNTASLETAIEAARDMRGCTKSIVIAPNFFLAHGPPGIRCFYELGLTDIVLNMGMLTTPKETWQCAISAANIGVKAITVHALAGTKSMTAAMVAAEASRATTHMAKRPRVFVTLLPQHLDGADMIDQLRMRVRRAGHVEQACRHLLEVGADGIIVEYEDIKYVRRVSRNIPFLVYAQRRALDYTSADHEDARALPGITEILDAGASHVIFDSELASRTDTEWASDMINKELEAANKG